MTTFPYFLRFLLYTNLSLWYLGYLLFQRFAALWASRKLPAYLGPNLSELVHLTLLGLFCAATSLALGIMLGTSVKGWAGNRTMIEGWEMERWEAVVERFGSSGDASFWNDADDENGINGWEDVEFPYDIGFFANMAQAMGSTNPLMWFFPFVGGPTIAKDGKGTGWGWPENGFNPREGMWPPPDPDKVRRARAGGGWPGADAQLRAEENVISNEDTMSRHDAKVAFLQRQADDMKRRQAQRRHRAADDLINDELYDVENEQYDEDGGYDEMLDEGMDGKPGWTNSDGDRLRDYGVDEDVEAAELVPVDRDDDVPLAELVRRRKPTSSAQDT
jgi:palmitoyltransferase